MSGPIRIQSLFAQLRVEQLSFYLEQKGWRIAPESRRDRQRFVLKSGVDLAVGADADVAGDADVDVAGDAGAVPAAADVDPADAAADQDDDYVLLLPISDASQQSRRALQHAIYNLSGVEDRQPAEILRDILALEVPLAPPSAVPAASPPGKLPPGKLDAVRLRFANQASTQGICVRVTSRPGETTLLPGEALEIVIQSQKGEVVEIGLRTVEMPADPREIR